MPYLVDKYSPTFKRNVIINGVKVDVAAKLLKPLELKQQKEAQKKQEDKYLIVTTNADLSMALANYKKRWVIEVFFQSVKSRGFNLEQTHLTLPERLNKLFPVVAMAFSFCLVTGVWVDECIAQIPRTSSGYKKNSFFRVGLDTLDRVIRRYGDEDGERFIRIINYIYYYS